MTLGGASKKWIFSQAPKTVRKGLTGPAFVGKPHYYPPVVVLDFSRKLKYLMNEKMIPGGTHFKNGHDFFKVQVVPEVQGYFDRGAKKVIINFDRGSPSNKYYESVKRNKNRNAYHVPDDLDQKIISDDVFPTREEWTNLVGNKFAAQEVIQYITDKFIETSIKPHHRDGFHFRINPGCSLIIHGGRLTKTKVYGCKEDGIIKGDPMSRMSPRETVVPRPRLIVARRDEKETIDEKTGKPTFLLHVTEETQDAERLSRLKEGEVAVMYFVRIFEMEDVMVVSGDGDLLLMLLMNSEDRIDPNTGKFRNRIFLTLKVAGKNDFVYINDMYAKLNEIYRYGKGATSCRQVMMEICLLLALPMNDFIRGFGYGVGTCKVKNDDFTTRANAGTKQLFGIETALKANDKRALENAVKKANVDAPFIECPWILKTYLDNIEAYGGFIKSWSVTGITLPPFSHGSTHNTRGFEVDETKFIRLTERMYYEKYKSAKLNVSFPSSARKYPEKYAKCEEKAKIETRKLLCSRKDKRKRMMVPRRIRVYSRQMLWLACYWYNSHRGNCQFLNPNVYYKGLPYYGWKLDAEGHSIPSHIVSVAVSNHVGKNQNDFKNAPHFEFKQKKTFVTRNGRFVLP